MASRSAQQEMLKYSLQAKGKWYKYKTWIYKNIKGCQRRN